MGVEPGSNGNVETFRPIFILGSPRSSTSTLAAIIDRHSKIAITPETQFFLYRRPPKPKRGESPHQFLVRHYPGTSAMWELNLDPQDVLQRFQTDTPTPENYYRRALESFGARFGKILVGDKSVHHVYKVDRIVRAFPGARFIWIIRDGRDAVQAVTRTKVFRSTRRSASFHWWSSMCAYEQALKDHGDRIHTIRFESLVREPEQEVRTLCGFLGVPFEPEMLDPSRPTASIPEKDLVYKSRSMRPFDPKVVGEHLRSASNRERALMESIMGGPLKRAGYSATKDRLVSPWIRGWYALSNLPFWFLYYHRFAGMTFWLRNLRMRINANW